MFLTSLDAREIGWKDGRIIWELLAPLIYQRDCGGIIQIPQGFQTDFCSVPRHPAFVFGLCGAKFNRTGTLHDYCYRIGSGFTFEEANDLFLESTSHCWPGEADFAERETMYRVLCMFGKAAYNKFKIGDKLV
jgi:hypothetical protein